MTRRAVYGWRLYVDFLRGLSVVGLARKYGRTSQEIQARLRKWL